MIGPKTPINDQFSTTNFMMDLNALLNNPVREQYRGPSFDPRWSQSLDLNLDQEIYNVKIIAYKVRWFNGKWSDWFFPGDGDVYKKTHEPARRYWACFYDHSHMYVYQPLANAEVATKEEKREQVAQGSPERLSFVERVRKFWGKG